MEVKKIVEGMTAPEVAQVIDDNFKAQNEILEADIVKQNNVIGVSEYTNFSEAEEVAVGAVRLKDGLLYECVEATTGAWDATKWKLSSFKQETDKKLTELDSEVARTFAYVGTGIEWKYGNINSEGHIENYSTVRVYSSLMRVESIYTDSKHMIVYVAKYKDGVFVERVPVSSFSYVNSEDYDIRFVVQSVDNVTPITEDFVTSIKTVSLTDTVNSLSVFKEDADKKLDSIGSEIGDKFVGDAILQKYAINSNGVVVNTGIDWWACSDFIEISSIIGGTEQIKILNAHNEQQGNILYPYALFYDENKSVISYITGISPINNIITINDVPSSAKYIRFNSYGNKNAYILNRIVWGEIDTIKRGLAENTNEVAIHNKILRENYFNFALFEKFAVIGDSYASGEIYRDSPGEPGYIAGDYYSLSWGQILARKNGISCINMSVGGLTSRTWLTSSRGLELLNSSDTQNLYIIALGLNDATYGADYIGTIADIHDDNSELDPDTFYGNMGKIVSAIQSKAPNAKIVLTTTPRNYGLYPNINNAIQSIAEHFGLPCCVVLSNYLFSSDIFSDNIKWSHPTAFLYSCMAKAYEELIGEAMNEYRTYFEDYIG